MATKSAALKHLTETAVSMQKLAESLSKKDAPLYEPAVYPAFVEAAFVAGGNIITVSKLYPIKEKVLDELSDHQFLLFFAADGEKLGEARIVKTDGAYCLVEA